MKIRNILGLAARVIVGGVLLYAGFMKAAGPSAEFAGFIAAYKIVPPLWVTPMSIGLPYIEMWTGLFVLTGLYTRQAAVAAMTLCAMFFLALLSTRLRGIDLASCGCFGADALSPRYTLLLDAGLFGLSLTIFKLSRSYPRWSLDQTLN